MTAGTQGTDRLERQRREFTLAKGTGPLIRFNDLTVIENHFLILEAIRNSFAVLSYDMTTMKRCYAETFHSWGVMCSHPMTLRLYEGKWESEVHLDFEFSPWFDCHLCNTRVINRGT